MGIGEILFYIWLTGAVGFGGYSASKCGDERTARISEGECYGVSVVAGIGWPVFLPLYVARELKD